MSSPSSFGETLDRRPDGSGAKSAGAYPLRPSSFLCSVIGHAILIPALSLIPLSGTTQNRPIYDEFIRPKEHQVLYYNFRPKIPEVTPRPKARVTREPRAEFRAPQTLIAASPKPKSEQQFVYMQEPKIDLRQDVPAPIVVTQQATALPSMNLPRPKPKTFVPPQEQKARQAPERVVIDSKAPPAVRLPEAPTVAVAVPQQLSLEGLAPPPAAPVAETAKPGNAPAEIAVVSLNPSNAPTLPAGDRPAQFSRAPEVGEANGGDVEGGLRVPDLTVRPPKEDTPPAAPSKPVLYAERVRTSSQATLSVPLRPSNRLIPRSVDARFPGRNVYALVVPIENFPDYGGDWIMWFAARDEQAGANSLVRGPVPYRKMEVVSGPLVVPKQGKRVQLKAVVAKDGSIGEITVVSAVTDAVQATVIDDLSSWEFKPATRNGIPVDVDIMVEIPFLLALSAP